MNVSCLERRVVVHHVHIISMDLPQWAGNVNQWWQLWWAGPIAVVPDMHCDNFLDSTKEAPMEVEFMLLDCNPFSQSGQLNCVLYWKVLQTSRLQYGIFWNIRPFLPVFPKKTRKKLFQA